MSYFDIIRKLKGFFFLFRWQIFIPDNFLNFLAHIAKLSTWIAKQKNIGYSDFYSFSFDYNRRYELHAYVIEKEGLNQDIDYLEFGVADGKSFKWWANKVKDTNSRFFGFDTFTGLPENWGTYKTGDMSGKNKIPELNDSRCIFYQGLFQQTLFKFLSTYNPVKRKVIHLDADLYTSTLFVLTSLSPYIHKGDILLFDEFNVPLHEFKAFHEWREAFYIDAEVIGAVNNFYQVAIKIK